MGFCMVYSGALQIGRSLGLVRGLEMLFSVLFADKVVIFN